MDCTVCGSANVKPAYKYNGYQLFRCNACSHLWIDGTASADASYDAMYYGASTQQPDKHTGYADYLGTIDRRIKSFRNRMDQIERLIGHRGDHLDFGCAVGACVKAAKDTGWNSIGYEQSSWAAEYGRQTFGIQIVDGSMPSEEYFLSGSFDVVTLWDVIEHVDEPRSVLDFVTRVLKPGGLLAMNTVNASSVGAQFAGRSWRHLEPPYHLQYFTRSSLRQLVVNSGFDIIQSSVNGVMLKSVKGSAKLSLPLQLIENTVTHWRMRRIATIFNLPDEVDIMAIRRS